MVVNETESAWTLCAVGKEFTLDEYWLLARLGA
jgi:hypothetical protein